MMNYFNLITISSNSFINYVFLLFEQYVYILHSAMKILEVLLMNLN